MSNNNYENIYKAFNCFPEATNSAYSAVNNFLEHLMYLINILLSFL